MKSALRIGMTGEDVQDWQEFLLGEGIEIGRADGQFGDKTREGTIEFQTRMKLTADGVVGRQTLSKAMEHGFPIIEEPADDNTGTNFPRRPDFEPLADNDARMALFGHYNFVSAPEDDNPEAIRILGSWEDDNIVKVTIPQLSGIKGAPGSGVIRFHKLGAKQLENMWAAWEAAKLLDRVLTWEGSFVPRFVRGSRKTLSNHAFGSAFDINFKWNQLKHVPALVGEKGSVRELVQIAHEHGFYWGGHFTRLDGMHFEVAVLKG